MNVKQFWTLIDEAREKSGWEEMYEPLAEMLSGLEIPDLMLWKQIFDEYQHLSYKNKLWAAAYVINGGCSDDGFDYFRGWLTAQGHDVFHRALRDPDSLADEESCEEDVSFEDMLSVAAEAYFRKTKLPGRDYDAFYADLEKYPLGAAIKSQMAAAIDYAKDIDADWEEDENLKEILPKLCLKFEY